MPRKIKLHFNRVNMSRKNPRVWSAHTSLSCNPSEEVFIRVNDQVIGKTVFRPEASQPRAFIEFKGEVMYENGQAFIQVNV